MSKKTSEKKIEKIWSKYISHPSDGKYVYTEMDREAIEHDLFETEIDKTSWEYVALLALYYGVTNQNLVRDFLGWHTKQLTKEKMELVEKIINIFKPYANEPMTGNVVILELQVVLLEIHPKEKEEVGK